MPRRRGRPATKRPAWVREVAGRSQSSSATAATTATDAEPTAMSRAGVSRTPATAKAAKVELPNP